MLYLCTISKIDYDKGRADVAFMEKEDTVKTDVPFMSEEYNMPNIGDMVVAYFQENKGRLERGFIIGKPYSSDNTPVLSGEGKYYKKLGDGDIKFENGTLTIEADKVVIKGGTVTLDGDVISLDGSSTVDGVSVKTHTHTGVHGETSGPH